MNNYANFAKLADDILNDNSLSSYDMDERLKRAKSKEYTPVMQKGIKRSRRWARNDKANGELTPERAEDYKGYTDRYKEDITKQAREYSNTPYNVKQREIAKEEKAKKTQANSKQQQEQQSKRAKEYSKTANSAASDYKVSAKPEVKTDVARTGFLKPAVAGAGLGAAALIGGGLYLANRKKNKEKEANYSYMTNLINF